MAYSTVHDGFPLGRWLNDQRQQARRDTTPSARHQALTAIDPWWNPPWDLAWQRTYTRARTTQTCPGGPPADARAWIRAQHTAWNHLRPEQQQLLTDSGVGQRPGPWRVRGRSTDPRCQTCPHTATAVTTSQTRPNVARPVL
ncbi:helicase associated domain-containing protein [Streptomyces sp. NPDC003032]